MSQVYIGNSIFKRIRPKGQKLNLIINQDKRNGYQILTAISLKKGILAYVIIDGSFIRFSFS